MTIPALLSWKRQYNKIFCNLLILGNTAGDVNLSSFTKTIQNKTKTITKKIVFFFFNKYLQAHWLNVILILSVLVQVLQKL